MPDAYLDHAASTPMRPEAVAAVVDVLERVPGNPSGQHRWARAARRRLDDAREQVAACIGAEPADIVFTSGGTEADNLAIDGVVRTGGGRPLCLETDHHAVLDPVRLAGGRTFAVGSDGVADLGDLAARLDADPGISVVSIALVNNEVGVVQPLAAVAEVVRRHAPGAVLHVDAVAAAGWLDLTPVVALADLVTISGHKVGGPKGIGVLVVRAGTSLAAMQRGGAQEHERRGGTQNVAGAAGLAAGLVATVADRPATVARVGELRDRLVQGLLAASPHLVETAGSSTGRSERVANIAHLSAWGVHREPLLFALDEAGIAASAGSSCASGALEPSHVVAALGLAPGLVDGSLRLSLGWCSTDAEVDHELLRVVPEVVARLHGTASVATTW